MLIILFFILIFLTVYPYVIYPITLRIFSFFYKKEVKSRIQTPLVSLIISAYNEEEVIDSRIENALAMDYPKDLLEIIVVSDKSTDGTDEIVRHFSSRGVVLIPQPVRHGKTAGLNKALSIVKGEIIVFTDSNSMFEASVVKKMATLFGDPKVGLVTGSTRYLSGVDGSMEDTSSSYTRLERYIKEIESRLGSCVGADGAIFAIRKSLYQTLADDEINDFVIPLHVVKQGYRAILGKDILCTENASQDSKREFKRQIRITNRTLRTIFRYGEFLNPMKYPIFSFQLVSHKIIRFCVPFYLLALIPLNLFLLNTSVIYKFFFAGQIIIYSSAILGCLAERLGYRANIFRLFYHFITVNLSYLLAWAKFSAGQKDKTWDTKRG